MDTPDPTAPIRLLALTHALDEQVSIFEELLGDPQSLIAAAERQHEVILAPPDPATLIHSGRGADRLHLGQTMEAVKAALGEPGDVTDYEELFSGSEEDLSCFGVTWYFERLGVEINFVEGKVKELIFHSGTYQGGLIPRSWSRWDGGLAPDMTWETVSEADLKERFGPPKNAYDVDEELSEIADEEPIRRVIYPGWTFEFLMDGRLQAVSLQVPKPPPEDAAELDEVMAELDELLADLEADS